MKYLVLIHKIPAVTEMFAAMSDGERAAAFQIYWDVESDLEKSGELVDSKALDEDTPQVVTRGADGPIVTDVARPAEIVSGYYLVDVVDASRAYEIAARFPEAAVEGGIRVARVLTQEDFDAMGA